MEKYKKTAALLLAVFTFFLNAFTAAAEKYTASYIDSLYKLTEYCSAFVPVKPNGQKSDFDNDFIQCISVDGEFYGVGLEHSERWSEWNEFIADIGADSLPVNSYADIRGLDPFGIVVNPDTGQNPNALYCISEEIIVLEDYHCKYNKDGELYRFASKEKYFGYRICRRVPKDRLYKSCWLQSGENKYYIGKDGLPVTSSTTIGGIRYKFGENGVCQGKYTGWTRSPKGRRYWKDGILQKNTEITTESGKTYTIDKNGYAKLKKVTK